MPAKIIETNNKPLKQIEVDGITVDIIENALRNAREEMDAIVRRTALSPGIREQGDCFPMIANKEGKMVVGQFGSFIYGFTEAYDEEIEEGDIILTNDPYMCNAAVSHLPDWIVCVQCSVKVGILHGLLCLVICQIMAEWFRVQYPQKLQPYFKRALEYHQPNSIKKVNYKAMS